MIDINEIVFEKATLSNGEDLVNIIHRCLKEVNYKDYTEDEINKFIGELNEERLSSIILTKHFYIAKYNEDIIGMGAVARDESQESQCYFTTMFVNPSYHKMGVGRKMVEYLEGDEWCIESKLIEIPASRTAHGFYEKLGYEYSTDPPIFKEDGSTIMYKWNYLMQM